VLLAASCRRDPPPRAGGSPVAAPVHAGVAVLAAPQDTSPFAGTTGVLHKARPGAPPAILAAVRVMTDPGYDRVVFEFAGDSLPGYHVEYVRSPVRRCGSGDPVALGGRERLVVRLEPAQAHDERGQPTVERRELAPGLPAITEMKLICDFEGQVEWALGVAATHPYRMLEATGPRPPRLTLDVRHRP